MGSCPIPTCIYVYIANGKPDSSSAYNRPCFTVIPDYFFSANRRPVILTLERDRDRERERGGGGGRKRREERENERLPL